MKKMCFPVVCMMLTCSLMLNAQNFRKLRVGLGGGYSSTKSFTGTNGGVIYLEPSYRINDQVAVGLRLETTLLDNSTATNLVDMDFSGLYSYSLNGQYYLARRFKGRLLKRPFVGLGLGVYSAPTTGGTSSFTDYNTGKTEVMEETLTSGNKLGFYPRFGFDVGHFVFTLEYNIGPSTKYSFALSDATTTRAYTIETKRNYLSIKVGFFLGGGRKRV